LNPKIGHTIKFCSGIETYEQLKNCQANKVLLLGQKSVGKTHFARKFLGDVNLSESNPIKNWRGQDTTKFYYSYDESIDDIKSQTPNIVIDDYSLDLAPNA